MKITSKPEQGTGWLKGLTNEQHHALPCVTSSKIKSLAQGCSLEYWYDKHIAKTIPYSPSSSAFLIGTVAHLAVLEPKVFEDSVTVFEDIDRRSKAYERYLAEFCAAKGVTLKEYHKGISCFEDAAGKQCYTISAEVEEMMRVFQKRCNKNPMLAKYLSSDSCVIEETGVAQDPDTGLWLALRGDARILPAEGRCGFFIDPKTLMDNITEENITRAVYNYKYNIQAAHYIETANLIDGEGSYKDFCFLFLSKAAPFEAAFCTLSEESFALGRKIRRECLASLSNAEETSFPPTEFGLQEVRVQLPKWLSKSINIEEV